MPISSCSSAGSTFPGHLPIVCRSSLVFHWPWPSVSSLAAVKTAVFRPSAPLSCPFKPKASQGHAYRKIQHFSFEAPFNTSDSAMRGCNRLRYHDERCEMFFFAQCLNEKPPCVANIRATKFVVAVLKAKCALSSYRDR